MLRRYINSTRTINVRTETAKPMMNPGGMYDISIVRAPETTMIPRERIFTGKMRALSVDCPLSAPVAHVHPERPDPRYDALGHDARRRPVVAPHPVRRRVGDEAARLLEREEDAAAADLPLVGRGVLGVRDVVHAVAHADDVGRVPLARARANVDEAGLGRAGEHLAVACDQRDRREAAGAVGLEPHLLAREGRHAGEGDRLHGAAGEAQELAVDEHLHLARVAREGLKLQEIAVLVRLIDGADEPEVQLAVDLDQARAREAGRLVRGAEIRAAAVRAPVLVEELAQAERIVAEAELGDVLRHGIASLQGSRASTWSPKRAMRSTCSAREAAGRLTLR